MTTPASLRGSYWIQDGSTGQCLNAITRTLQDRIVANYRRLGLTKPTQVSQGDELPGYLPELPWILIVPLGEGADSMLSMNERTEAEHTFPITVGGYYKGPDLDVYTQQIRSYGGRMVDLMSERLVEGYSVIDGSALAGRDASVELYNPSLDVGAERISDYVLHWWLVKITATGIW